MNTAGKIAIIGLSLAGLTAGTIYLVRLSRFQQNLGIAPVRVMVHKLFPLTIRIDVLIKNPSRTAIRIMQPYVELFYKGASVARSQVVDKELLIEKYSEVPLAEPIMLQIPLMGLFSIGKSLLDDLTSGQEVKVHLQTISQVKLATGWRQYKPDPEEFILKKSTATA